MEQPLLEVTALTRVHVMGDQRIHALDGLDLRVPHGEFLAVLGVSGSGKSTLLQLLGALDTPTTGSIRVNGEDLGTRSPLQKAEYRATSENEERERAKEP